MVLRKRCLPLKIETHLHNPRGNYIYHWNIELQCKMEFFSAQTKWLDNHTSHKYGQNWSVSKNKTCDLRMILHFFSSQSPSNCIQDSWKSETRGETPYTISYLQSSALTSIFCNKITSAEIVHPFFFPNVGTIPCIRIIITNYITADKSSLAG